LRVTALAANRAAGFGNFIRIFRRQIFLARDLRGKKNKEMAVSELIKKELAKKADRFRAKNLSRFFKTKPGEYGAGDLFLGIRVPDLRIVAKKYFSKADLTDIQILLKSKIHEERMTALLILLLKYKRIGEREREKIFRFYLRNTKFINNWDLVDVSCRDIIGNYLFKKDKKILYKLAKSKNLWERRISIISTFYFISRNQIDDTLKIAKILLNDKHDLIHKAVGWALREAGKKSLLAEKKFLEKYASHMPRVMLRYAIEKFPLALRENYLKLK